MPTTHAAISRCLLGLAPLCLLLSCATMPEMVRHTGRPTQAVVCPGQNPRLGPAGGQARMPGVILEVPPGVFADGTVVQMRPRPDSIAGFELTVSPPQQAQGFFTIMIDLQGCRTGAPGQWSIWHYRLDGSGDTTSLPSYRRGNYIITDSARHNSGFMVAN